MKIALCTLVLNEIEWLEKLYQQHKNWPGLVKWVFVEAADQVYASTNPELVSSEGLSVDGTSEFLQYLASKDFRIQYIPFGFTANANPALGKIAARQAYLDALIEIAPEFLLILDADEFYLHQDQILVNTIMENEIKEVRHFCFQFTHPWHPKSIIDYPLFSKEVVGGFWKMRHTKGVRWSAGLSYTSNHQRPDDPSLTGDLKMYEEPHCIHMAFASDHLKRKAKNEYYKSRGENRDKQRKWYCDSRACFETWRPGMSLPRGAKVIDYTGQIPECFISVEK